MEKRDIMEIREKIGNAGLQIDKIKLLTTEIVQSFNDETKTALIFDMINDFVNTISKELDGIENIFNGD